MLHMLMEIKQTDLVSPLREKVRYTAEHKHHFYIELILLTTIIPWYFQIKSNAMFT